MRVSYLLTIIFLWMGWGVEAHAQVSPHRLDVSGSYIFAGSMHDGVTNSSGPGIAVALDFRPARFLGIAFGVQLHRMGIDQDQPIDRWDWGYWELEWQNQSDILLRSPDYSAEQIPVQNVTMISGGIMPSIGFGSGRIEARLAAGPSITYFARSLYLDEHWSRYYPEADHTFEMSFRNYAEDKTGYEMGIDARISADYRISSLLGISTGVQYRRLLNIDTERLPLNDLVAVQVALAFRY